MIWEGSEANKNVSEKICDLSQKYFKTVTYTIPQLKQF